MVMVRVRAEPHLRAAGAPGFRPVWRSAPADL